MSWAGLFSPRALCEIRRVQAPMALSDQPDRLRIRRLALTDFRSYPRLDLAVAASRVALVGENGAGKTNVLEAISMFAPGRGLRRSEFIDCARTGGGGGWAVALQLERGSQTDQLGTGLAGAADSAAQRRNRINGATVSASGAFAEYLRLVWLTPEMDGLFAGSPGDRRRFLDRVVLSIDTRHAARVASLERAARSRNRLLEEGTRNGGWLDAVEHEIAELGVAVAAARNETVERLRSAAMNASERVSPFPWAEIELVGDIERLVPQMPALALEDRFRLELRKNRERDAAARRMNSALRPADLRVLHGPKRTAAARCSTGEQKALLVGLVLAQARLVAATSGMTPLVLLDEIGAHFDPARRAALFADLAAIGGQVWMTGADDAVFSDLGSDVEIFVVENGALAPLKTGAKGEFNIEKSRLRLT